MLSKTNVTTSNSVGAGNHPAKIADTVMDPFSYLVVLTSIVLGLGVTRLVGGLGHLMQTRRRKRPYWVHILWMVNLLLAMAIVWWVAYRWRSNEHWTFLLFIWLLLLPTILYLISSLLFPDQDDEPITDWRAYFYENHRDIFLLYALIFPIDIVDTLLKGMAHFRRKVHSTRRPWGYGSFSALLPRLPNAGCSMRVSRSSFWSTTFFSSARLCSLTRVSLEVRPGRIEVESRMVAVEFLNQHLIHNPTGCLASKPRGGR